MNIVVREFSVIDRQPNSVALKKARSLFVEYFLGLYQGMSSEHIGIDRTVEEYLQSIFDKNEEAVCNDPLLRACFAIINDEIVGFTTYGLLENQSSVLIRTWPINVNYSASELAIRNAFIKHIEQTIDPLESIVIMIRKANTKHEQLCKQDNFARYDAIFQESDYVRKTYNTQWYHGYIRSIA